MIDSLGLDKIKLATHLRSTEEDLISRLFGSQDKGFNNIIEGMKYIGRRDLYWKLTKENQYYKSSFPQRIERPYPGLRAFNDEENNIFFGRESELKALQDRLEKNGNIFIVGDSGAGKSSLLIAGIIPSFNHRNFQTYISTPSEDESSLFGSLIRSIPEISSQGDLNIRKASQELYETGCISILENYFSESGNIICIDQLEEVFSPSIDEDERYRFLEFVSRICLSKNISFISTLRIDYLERFLTYESICELLQNNSFILGAMTNFSLYKAITRPAELAGIDLDEELLDKIIEDRSGEKNALPLIACTLRKLSDLSEIKKPNRMTLKLYNSFGGLHGVIVQSADVAVRNSGVSSPDTFNHVFSLLVHIDTQTLKPVRRRAFMSEFEQNDESLKLIQAFINERLFVSGINSEGVATVEVAHESIFIEWDRIDNWIKEKGLYLQAIRKMQLDVLNWEKQNKNINILPNNEILKPIHDAIHILNYKPSKLESEYIELEEIRIWKHLNSGTASHQEKATSGVRLCKIGDNRKGVNIDENGKPLIYWVDCSEYFSISKETEYKKVYVSKYLVTWAQYKIFLQLNSSIDKSDRLIESQNHKYENHPADMISWVDACKYCEWVSNLFGVNIRLPTTVEWMTVASNGDMRRKYPWGDEFNVSFSNTQRSGLNRTTAVGLFPVSNNENEIMDFIGNVWEWCLDDPDVNSTSKLMHGGSFKKKKGETVTIFDSLKLERNYRDADLGFRIWKFIN